MQNTFPQQTTTVQDSSFGQAFPAPPPQPPVGNQESAQQFLFEQASTGFNPFAQYQQADYQEQLI